MQEHTKKNNSTRMVAFPIFDIRILEIGDMLIAQDNTMWIISSITKENIGIFPYCGGMEYNIPHKMVKNDFAKLISERKIKKNT